MKFISYFLVMLIFSKTHTKLFRKQILILGSQNNTWNSSSSWVTFLNHQFYYPKEIFWIFTLFKKYLDLASGIEIILKMVMDQIKCCGKIEGFLKNLRSKIYQLWARFCVTFLSEHPVSSPVSEIWKSAKNHSKCAKNCW